MSSTDRWGALARAAYRSLGYHEDKYGRFAPKTGRLPTGQREGTDW
ncbi:MAG: hypothetical protein ACREH3_18665 [Geminicoccales bacterium]